MPHFANPGFLLLALLVPPLLWWWLRRRPDALRYPDTGWLRTLPAGRARVALWGGVVLRGAALLALVVALAGPRWPDLRSRIPAEGIGILLVVDVSGSMAEPDFDWKGQPVSRLDAVKKVLRLFVEGGDADDHHFTGRPEDLLGLVTFATRPDAACPLTLSHSVLLRMLEAEQPRSVPGESETNISDAVTLGLHRLLAAEPGPKRKVIVLLSDGEHNVPHPQSDWTPRQSAQIAANLNIPVYAIDAGGAGTGSEPGAAADSAARRAEGSKALQEVAHITRGRYFRADDTAALLTVCQEIDRLERSEIQSFQYRRYHEGFVWFALAAFALLTAVRLLEMTWWRRVP
jgi:Ca-activated chloride channel homolog